MSHEKLVITIGAIFLVVSLLILNVVAFNTIEVKVLDAMDKKCPTYIQVTNNITEITQQITNNITVVQRPIILNEEEEDD